MRIRKGQKIEIDVDRVAIEGRGVGRWNDIVIFVDKALPGERVEAAVSKVKRRFVRARTTRVLRASPQRIEGRCSHLDVCGGCVWQELEYGAQLEAKQGLVREALQRLGGFTSVQVPPTLASPDVYYYRNKMEFSFFDGFDGEIVLGLHTPGTFDRVFDLEACYLMSPQTDQIVAAVRRMATRSGLPAYHSRRHVGYWRYLVVREAKNKNQTMVNIVTNEGPFPNPGGFVTELQEVVPNLTSVIHSTTSSKANIAIGQREEVLFGSSHISERIGEFDFKIRPKSFFQTNPRQAQRLFELTVEMAKLQGDDDVLDLYSGAGAISLFLARKARRVTGIEVVEDAVQAARENARQNGIDNCDFHLGEVKDFVKKQPGMLQNAGVVVTDPPRAGLHVDIVSMLRQLRPSRIVYVSCNPSTLARDLQLLCGEDRYRLAEVRPVDMFPHTYHIEVVARLESTNST